MQNRFPYLRLLNDPLRIAIEQCVSTHIGRRWTVGDVKDMHDFASHQASILSDGSYSVFVKFSEAANGSEQFEIELAGLCYLAQHSGVLTPTPIAILLVEGGSLLILEAARAVDRGPRQWRQIGQALACIHKVKGEQCGFPTQGYFGPLYQDNRPMHSWPAFFAERRLWPRLMAAVDSGNLPSGVIRLVEKLISHLPDLCGPEVTPCLLHGDAQKNNYISTEAGAMVIDPAVYYGNPEFDLAYVDYFEPVPEDVFQGYREELPIDPGFNERRDLWRLYGYLAIVAVEGPAYLNRLTDAVQKYI
jgi:protein-ribulosamine 3-kinase